MQDTLEDLRSRKFALMGTGATLEEYLSVVGFDDWTAIEGRYRTAEPNSK